MAWHGVTGSTVATCHVSVQRCQHRGDGILIATRFHGTWATVRQHPCICHVIFMSKKEIAVKQYKTTAHQDGMFAKTMC